MHNSTTHRHPAYSSSKEVARDVLKSCCCCCPDVAIENGGVGCKAARWLKAGHRSATALIRELRPVSALKGLFVSLLVACCCLRVALCHSLPASHSLLVALCLLHSTSCTLPCWWLPACSLALSPVPATAPLHCHGSLYWVSHSSTGDLNANPNLTGDLTAATKPPSRSMLSPGGGTACKGQFQSFY